MLRDAALVAGKDLRIELRSRVGLNQIGPFAIVVPLLFGLALGPDRQVLAPASAGLFWVAVRCFRQCSPSSAATPSSRPTPLGTGCACPDSTPPGSSSARRAPSPPSSLFSRPR